MLFRCGQKADPSLRSEFNPGVILNGAPEAWSEGSMHFARRDAAADGDEMHGSFAAAQDDSALFQSLQLRMTAPFCSRCRLG
jgi:hypothetical protein